MTRHADFGWRDNLQDQHRRRRDLIERIRAQIEKRWQDGRDTRDLIEMLREMGVRP